MKSNDSTQNTHKIHKNNSHTKSPEKREIILLNNKLYDLNNNLNDLFEKYKNNLLSLQDEEDDYNEDEDENKSEEEEDVKSNDNNHINNDNNNGGDKY